MKNTIILFFVAMLIIINSCNTGNSQTVKTSLNAQEFSDKIKELPNAPLVDVRTPEEYSKGRLANAVNINWNDASFETEISKLDKNKPVLVYCLSGGRSGQAATKMRADGFKEVYELVGGIMQWRAAGLPETQGNASASNSGMTKEQFDKLLDTKKVVLIDFYADWCGPCKKMKPYLEEIANDMKDKVEVVRIDVDKNQQLAKDMGVTALPTLLVYKNKKQTWNYVGYIEKAEVLKQLK